MVKEAVEAFNIWIDPDLLISESLSNLMTSMK